jgi:hypothetical protein
MQQEMIMNVGPQGQVTGLHFDEFPLGFLGPMEIGRASEILWDETDQSWFVTIPGQSIADVSDAASGFTTYKAARQFEVEWLQGCMKEGVDPLSPQGENVALELRLLSPDY